jgi:NADPH:quinone reductase-like Zn-dependent oxidoreductase
VRAVYLERFGGPDVLTFGDRPAPNPKPGEVLVRVRACGINHLDLWVRAGLTGLEPEMPHILGNDVVGEITELAQVSRT